jgi:hypothetical protein
MSSEVLLIRFDLGDVEIICVEYLEIRRGSGIRLCLFLDQSPPLKFPLTFQTTSSSVTTQLRLAK